MVKYLHITIIFIGMSLVGILSAGKKKGTQRIQPSATMQQDVVMRAADMPSSSHIVPLVDVIMEIPMDETEPESLAMGVESLFDKFLKEHEINKPKIDADLQKLNWKDLQAINTLARNSLAGALYTYVLESSNKIAGERLIRYADNHQIRADAIIKWYQREFEWTCPAPFCQSHVHLYALARRTKLKPSETSNDISPDLKKLTMYLAFNQQLAEFKDFNEAIKKTRDYIGQYHQQFAGKYAELLQHLER